MVVTLFSNSWTWAVRTRQFPEQKANLKISWKRNIANRVETCIDELSKKVPMSTQKCQLASCPKSQRVQPRPGERVRAPSALVSPMPPCLASPLVLRSVLIKFRQVETSSDKYKQVPTNLVKFRQITISLYIPIWKSLDQFGLVRLMQFWQV